VFLTELQLFELTRKLRHDAQVRVLRAMGIEHKVRPDGSVAVLKAHVEHLLGGTSPLKVNHRPEPDWNAIAKTKEG
jgi:hypothetical protein